MKLILNPVKQLISFPKAMGSHLKIKMKLLLEVSVERIVQEYEIKRLL